MAIARKEGHLIEGLTLEELKQLSLEQEGVIQTQIGSIAAGSEPMSRSAPHTKNSINHEFGEEEEALVREAVEVLSKERIVLLDTIVADGKDGSRPASLSRRNIHILRMLSSFFWMVQPPE
jgi:phosphoenolpyruvate carboxykinase (ATP)